MVHAARANGEYLPSFEYDQCAQICDGVEINGQQPGVMFVRVVESVKSVQECIPAILECVEGAKHFPSGQRQLFLFRNGRLEFVPCPTKWEPNCARGGVCLEGDGAQHLVQGRSEIVKDCTDAGVKSCGD